MKTLQEQIEYIKKEIEDKKKKHFHFCQQIQTDVEDDDIPILESVLENLKTTKELLKESQFAVGRLTGLEDGYENLYVNISQFLYKINNDL